MNVVELGPQRNCCKIVVNWRAIAGLLYYTLLLSRNSAIFWCLLSATGLSLHCIFSKCYAIKCFFRRKIIVRSSHRLKNSLLFEMLRLLMYYVYAYIYSFIIIIIIIVVLIEK